MSVGTSVSVGDFEDLLAESVKTHGHLCPGQVLGVRMALHGLSEIGIAEPKGCDRKKLIVFVETDRCATDAIQSVTGCSLGKRTLKFMDLGKMAATFLNLATGCAVRIVAREDAKEKARECRPDASDRYVAQAEAYRRMMDTDLFVTQRVGVTVNPHDMPGRPLSRVTCDLCGEHVQDGREVRRGAATLCRSCAEGSYFTREEDINPAVFFMPSVMQKSQNAMEIRSKLWIEVGGEPVFGRGRRLLLEAIDRHGSINRGAKEINISYRRAWSYIKAMEERLGVKLVERQSGGKNGGGAVLTNEARQFLHRYSEMEKGIREFVDQRYRDTFFSPRQGGS
ncbi:MAG: FmdE family protein [Chloroflexota bacterium]